MARCGSQHRQRALSAALGLGFALCCRLAAGAPPQDPGAVAYTTTAPQPTLVLSSLKARRDAGVVKQVHDYSCGSAALATLLTYGLGDPVGESELLQSLFGRLSSAGLAALAQNGLSLTQLQSLAQERGHRAQGFRVAASQLHRISRPVIVFIRPGGYAHFAVLKGLQGDRVHLADPTLGNVRMPLYRFLDMWADASGQGVLMAVEPASGSWPEVYRLQIGEAALAPIETVAAQHLGDHAAVLAPSHAGR